MTRILLSPRSDGDLLELDWETRAGADAQLQCALRFLDAARVNGVLLGELAGELKVRGPAASDGIQVWEVNTAHLAELRERVTRESPVPLELTLRCEPVAFLPDDELELIDFDSIELWSLGSVPLRAAPEVVAPATLRAWRVPRDPSLSKTAPLLWIDMFFDPPPVSTGVIATVRSQCDLWLPARLDGESSEPYGPSNAGMLVRCFRELADLTGATLHSRGLTAEQGRMQPR